VLSCRIPAAIMIRNVLHHGHDPLQFPVTITRELRQWSHRIPNSLTQTPLPLSPMRPLLTHGAIWSAVGAVGGLAFGLGLGGRGRWKATLVGGFIGAAVATVIYELVGAVVFASSKTDLPLSSSSTTRGMALLLVASLSSIGAVLALRRSAKREARSSVPL
jgi:hypothetical protein